MVRGMPKKNYFFIDTMIEGEKSGKIPNIGPLLPLHCALDRAEIQRMHGLKLPPVKELLRSCGVPDSPINLQGRFDCGYKIQDVSSNNGIPDFIGVLVMHPEHLHSRYGNVFSQGDITFLNRSAARYLVNDPTLRCAILISTSLESAEEINIRKSKGNGQVLTGSCNAREESAVKLASRLSGLSFSAFVTKATLYMARFINRHRRNEEGHPYHPGEAYLFMERGEKMQDAFTPEEVAQAMEKVGISGSRVASDLMAELERLRKARMEPEA